MENPKIRANTDKLLKFIADKMISNELDNQSLVEVIQLCGQMLNMATIPNYAKQHKMSYEGVKKYRPIQEIFGVRFVIDNL